MASQVLYYLILKQTYEVVAVIIPTFPYGIMRQVEELTHMVTV